MPNICVTPIRVAARDAGKFVVARYRRADQRKDTAGPLQEAADTGQHRVAGREQHCAHAHCRRTDRDGEARTQLVHGDARYKTEGRIAVIEKTEEPAKACG